MNLHHEMSFKIPPNNKEPRNPFFDDHNAVIVHILESQTADRRKKILKVGGGGSWRNLGGRLSSSSFFSSSSPSSSSSSATSWAFPSPGCRCHVRRKAGRGRGGSPKGGCGPSDPSRVRSHPCQIYLTSNGHPSHGQSLSRAVLMLFCRALLDVGVNDFRWFLMN